MRKRASQWLITHRYPLLAAFLILVASAIRIGLIAQGWPGTDSDDSTMGLMAKHILTYGEHPIFFYGQSYMGAIEAYVGALMFALLGVSSFALKCGLILIYAAFMASMYLLLSQAFNHRWALAGLLLLSLGDDDMLYHQLEAYGGYLETLLFGVLLIVLAAWLIRTIPDPALRKWRSWGYLGWGLAAGLGIWSDPLVAPFVIFSALFLLLTCWRELRHHMAILALAGLLIGVSPWLIYIATAPSLGAATSFLQRGTLPQTQRPASTGNTTAPAAPPIAPTSPTFTEIAIDHVRGTVMIAVANNTGATALCPLTLTSAWPPDHWTSPQIVRCIAIRGVWGSGFLVLLSLAIGLETHAFLRLRHAQSGASAAMLHAAAARGAMRLIAIGAPGATILLFSLGSVSSFAPYQYSRYLISIAIALPVAIATLWEHASHLQVTSPAFLHTFRVRHIPRLGALAAAILLFIALAAGTLATYGEIPTFQAYAQQQATLVHWLIQHDDTRIYSDYWTCIRTIFQSNERVVCSVVGTQFEPKPNRYPPYDSIVAASSHPAYVFQLSSAQTSTFPRYAAQLGWTYSRSVVDGQFVVFRLLTS